MHCGSLSRAYFFIMVGEVMFLWIFLRKKDFFSFCFFIWHGRCNEDSAGLSIKVLARKKKGFER